jgi:predicted ArsR family transcriptional regulator
VDDESVLAVAVLADPVRRSAYRTIQKAAEPLSRDDVARDLAIGRPLAAFHLDRLAEAGLVEVSYARPPGRTGPGAGRPAKLYRLAPREVAVSLPPRSYGDLAALLAEALERAGADDIAVAVARVQGLVAGRGAGADALPVLEDRGYAPSLDGDRIVLRSCPFHAVAREFPPLVCGMNLALLQGIAEGAGWAVEPCLDPAPGRCCVTLGSKKASN